MTIIYTEDKKFITLLEFLNITESIAPKETDYGTDFKNKKWKHSNSNFYITFFSHDKNFQVLVVLNKDGVLSFATYNGEQSTNLEKYDLTRSHLNNALKIFNKVIYVAIEGSNILNIKLIKFNGQDEALDKTYNLIANNKMFQIKMKNFGFNYIGLDSNKQHIFSKENI